MVAITVILAAVIGTFVIGLGDGVGDTAPQASFDTDTNETNTEVTFTHRSGDSIPNGTAYLVASGGVSLNDTQADSNVADLSDGRAAVEVDLSAGSSVSANVSGTDGSVSLVYDDGDRSTTLKTTDIE